VEFRTILNQLPYSTRRRFEWVSGYVQAVVESLETGKTSKRKLTKSEIHVIQIAVLVRSLEFFFREGSRAARGAVNSLETVGVPGFTIGSSEFLGENENVSMGDSLADKLMRSLTNVEWLQSTPDDLAPSELIEWLYRKIISARE
jgi:hypothetical protein